MSSSAKRFGKKKGSKVTLKHHLKAKDAYETNLTQEGVVGIAKVRQEDVKFHNS